MAFGARRTLQRALMCRLQSEPRWALAKEAFNLTVFGADMQQTPEVGGLE